MIIDTHTHLDDDKYLDDLEDVLTRAKEKGVERFIIPGASAYSLQRAIELSERYESIYFAIGIHPYDIASFNEDDFIKNINHKKCVAVGECGLDYFRLEGDDKEKEMIKKAQKEIFIKQIEIAKKYKKPLIIHVRDASKDSKKILLEYNSCKVGGVLHCFNADEELLSLVNENFYFGIGGVVTFKNAKKLVNILPKIPLDRLLIETDAPYLTPTPYRGQRNEPSYTSLVAEKISEILAIEVQNIEKLTTNNAMKLFFN